MNHCHITDTTWNPRPLPGAFAEIAENYQNMPPERHLADGWRVAVPYVDEPGYRHDSRISTVMFGDTLATEMPGALINIAEENDAAKVAAEKAEKEWLAAEDSRILALPSVAAIVAENAALKVAAKEQAIRQAAELATLTAALDKAKDAASVAASVKAWAIAEKGEKDSAAAVSEAPK
jgi:hypothetical protein